MHANPLVSVVIPTIGRRSLESAILSVLRQTIPVREILVIFDGPEANAPTELAELDPAVRVLATSKASNANTARNLGVRASSGDLIAFLDDDDAWAPDKLEQQIAITSSIDLSDDAWLCTCPVLTRGEISGEVWPSEVIRVGERVQEYLFRSRLSRRKPFIQPSTWLGRQSLFRNFPFREDVGLHDDFDWLIRTQASIGLRFVFCSKPLVYYTTLSRDSVVARSGWRDSVSWILDPSLAISDRIRGDFVLAIPHRMALRSLGRLKSMQLFVIAFRVGRPGLPAVVTALLRMVRGH